MDKIIEVSEMMVEKTNEMPRSIPRKMVIGMIYTPMQEWEEPYDPETGLECGTIFPSLDLPFLGKNEQTGALNRGGNLK